LAAAATLLVEDGQVKKIARKSGHSHPAVEFLHQAVAGPKVRGVAPGFAVLRDI